ncbi:hypothetical protein GIB67_016556, partial [Kingdonia uniflora]
MFEEWVTDSPFIIPPRISFKVQGRDRLYIKFVAEELGLEGSYVPRTYIEQIQLKKLVDEVMALPDDSKTKLSIEDDLVSSSPKDVLYRASADRVAMRNKNFKSGLSHTYSTRGNNNLNLTRLAVNNRRMDQFTSRIEELNSKFTIRRVSNASHQNLALHAKACNDTATSLFVSGFGNGSLSGSLLPNSSSSSQLARDSPLMDEILLIKRGQVSFMDHTVHSLNSDSAVADTAGNIPSRASSSSRRRGPSRGSKPLPDGKKKKVEVNSWGQPIRGVNSYSTTVETLTRNHIPINYKKFTSVPDEFIHIVKRKLERVANFSIMRRMNDAWKRHKSRLNKKYIKGKDPTKAQSKKNTENCNKVNAPCTTGRTSMAIVRHNLVVERNARDEDVGRANVFIKAHTKADKTYQCPKIIEKLQENMNLYPDLSKIGYDDVLAKTLAKDKKGHMMAMGIVAYGIVADVSPDAYCHNKKLGDGYYKIEIFNVINEDALLFRQDSFTKTMGDVGVGDLESTISDEDEALFGNLFSEEISSTYSSTDPRTRIAFQRNELSKGFNLESWQVKFWFQNRHTQMKTQLERHENSILRQENDKLQAENMSIRDAMRTPICNNCGEPAMLGEISLEGQQLRVENVRIQDELNRVCTLAEKFLGMPVSSLATSISSHMPNSDLELAVGCNGLTGLSTVTTSLPLGNDYGGVLSPLSTRETVIINNLVLVEILM